MRYLSIVGIGLTVFFSMNNLLRSVDYSREIIYEIGSERNLHFDSDTSIFQQPNLNSKDENYGTSETLTQVGDGESSHYPEEKNTTIFQQQDEASVISARNIRTQVGDGESSHYPEEKNTTIFQQQEEAPVISAIISASGTLNTTHKSTQLNEHYISTREYRASRNDTFNSWFKQGTNKLLKNADKNGPILDFIIVGFAKCGTTTVSANLAYITPMPVGDICTQLHQTVYYAYKNWPDIHGREKLLRGSKCPADINRLKIHSKHLPRTKLIIGIRHPVR